MKSITIEASDEVATAVLGRALAELLPDGAIVALDGPLGAGKTRLVQAIAAALGVEQGAAVSPTFVLVQHYQGTRAIVHVDAYRMRDEEEFLDLGADELLASDALVLIEWAQRVKGALPGELLQVAIGETGKTSRRFHLTATGTRYESLIDKLAETYAVGKGPQGERLRFAQARLAARTSVAR